MNILLTGASGGLGQNLLGCLTQQKGLTLRALVHRSPVNFEGCAIVHGDLNDPASLVRATEGVDTVVHLAALTHSNREQDYFRVNVKGSENLIAACAENGVERFVYVSSRAAHPKGGGYAESKLRAEERVKSSTMEWLILRPAEVYGKNSPDAINKLVHWIREFKVVPIIGDGQYKLTPVFIDDIIPAIARAVVMRNLQRVTLALGGPEDISFTSLVDRIGGYLGVKPLKIFIPVFMVQWLVAGALLFKKDFLTRDQVPRLLCDKSSPDEPALKALDYNPRKLEEGLSQYLSPETL